MRMDGKSKCTNTYEKNGIVFADADYCVTVYAGKSLHCPGSEKKKYIFILHVL